MTLTETLRRPLPALSACGVMLAALACWTGPAQAQNQQMLDRMDRMERELQTLQRQTFGAGARPPASGSPYTTAPLPGGGSGDATATARLEVRMGELEHILATVTGRIEELTFQNQSLQNRLDKLVGDVDFRLRSLEQGGARPPGDIPPPQAMGQGAPQAIQPQASAGFGASATAPGAVQMPGGRTSMTVPSPGGSPMPPAPSAGLPPPSSQPGVLGTMSASELAAAQRTQAASPPPSAPAVAQPAAAGAVTLPQGSARDQYEYAYSLLRQRNYEGAEMAFRQFVDLHKTDELSGNALYWLGETHYVRRQFEPAAIAFLEGYKNFPKGSKAPDNLLKLGMSLAGLNRQKEACTTLSKLNAEFPDAASNLKAVADNERRKLACAG